MLKTKTTNLAVNTTNSGVVNYTALFFAALYAIAIPKFCGGNNATHCVQKSAQFQKNLLYRDIWGKEFVWCITSSLCYLAGLRKQFLCGKCW